MTDLKYYRDGRFTLMYPEPWHAFELEGADGRRFAEERDGSGASLSIEVTTLPTSVTAADLPTLRQGFLEGLRAAHGSRILRQDDYDVGFAIGLEAEQSWADGRRWVRVLYREDKQFRLVAQAPSDAEFERWLPDFKPAMTAFRLE